MEHAGAEDHGDEEEYGNSWVQGSGNGGKQTSFATGAEKTQDKA